jgi:hypothetical protein
MHSPDVVVFDLHIPVPKIKWKRLPDQRQWSLDRRRYECREEESPLCGTPIYPWWRPAAWRLTLGGWEIGWTAAATVWHHEPDGADTGDTCKGMGGTELTAHNVRWAWQHRAHLQVQWLHYQQARRWLRLRCDRCDLPFRGKYRTRYSSWSGDGSMHRHCAMAMLADESDTAE